MEKSKKILSDKGNINMQKEINTEFEEKFHNQLLMEIERSKNLDKEIILKDKEIILKDKEIEILKLQIQLKEL